MRAATSSYLVPRCWLSDIYLTTLSCHRQRSTPKRFPLFDPYHLFPGITGKHLGNPYHATEAQILNTFRRAWGAVVDILTISSTSCYSSGVILCVDPALSFVCGSPNLTGLATPLDVYHRISHNLSNVRTLFSAPVLCVSLKRNVLFYFRHPSDAPYRATLSIKRGMLERTSFMVRTVLGNEAHAEWCAALGVRYE